MTLTELVTEFLATRSPGWLVLDQAEALACAIDATRYYAGYGDIRSISGADGLPSSPPPAPPPDPPADEDVCPVDAAPIKNLALILPATDLSMGEWAVIRPLFFLYCERESAHRLEASRGMGVDVYGRAVSEIAQDIRVMEDETLPAKAFVQVAVEV